MEVVREKSRVVVKLGGLYRSFSTLPNPQLIDKIAFIQVGHDFKCCFEEVADAVRGEFGDLTAVFLTAADLSRHFGAVEDPPVRLFGSVSLSPPSCVGTINLAVVADVPLSRWGMADLMRTVAEAKCLAVTNRLLRCGGKRSPGTVTDAVLVAVPVEKSESIHFAGFATEIGGKTAKLVERLVSELDGGDLFERALGVTYRDFAEAFAQLAKRAPLPASPEEAVEKLKEFLRDPNVWALVMAASELDALAAAGAVPGLSAEEHAADTPRVVVDELLGVALADYLGGFNAVLTTYWVERVKREGGFKELSMFSDDVFSALLAAAYLELYRKYLKR